MANPAKRKLKTESISVAKIYENLQSREFLQELWWDLILDMENKPAYKRLKKMVTHLVNQTLDGFSTEFIPDDEEECAKRRSALSDISIMTYTVDIVVTEVLYRKLQNEYFQLISNLVEDVKQERKHQKSNIPDYSILENRNNEAEKANSRNTHTINNAFSSDATASTSKDFTTEQPAAVSTLDANEDSITTEAPPPAAIKRGRPKKTLTGNIYTPKRARGRPRKIKRVPESHDEFPPRSNNISNPVQILPFNVQDEGDSSETESVISFGHTSIDTVSSVHTSELSSFEDTISICSEDEENGKRKSHISLKLANDMYLSGKLSEIYRMGKEAEKIKIKSSNPLPLPKDEETKEPASENANTPRPQRVRKPNSKYNPETMFCQVKDYSTSQGNMNVHEEQNAVSSKSPQKQKKQKPTSSDEGKLETSSSPTRNFSAILSARTSPNHSKSTPKRSSKYYNPSDLYKPHPIISNAFQGRGTTAVTLFST